MLGCGLGWLPVCSVALGSPLFSKPYFPISNHPPAGQRPAQLSSYRMGQVVVSAAAGGGAVRREGSGLPSGDAGTRTHVSQGNPGLWIWDSGTW